MKMYNLVKIFLGVLFLAVIGTRGMYAQENTINYFAQAKATCAIPSRIDEGSLTQQDKKEMKDEEYDFEYCEEEDNDYWFWFGPIFDMDKDARLLFIQEYLEGFQVISDQDGIVVAIMIMEDEDYRETQRKTKKVYRILSEQYHQIGQKSIRRPQWRLLSPALIWLLRWE